VCDADRPDGLWDTAGSWCLRWVRVRLGRRLKRLFEIASGPFGRLRTAVKQVERQRRGLLRVCDALE